MPHAEVAIVPGSHGGFNRIDELNDRIAAFIEEADKARLLPTVFNRIVHRRSTRVLLGRLIGYTQYPPVTVRPTEIIWGIRLISECRL